MKVLLVGDSIAGTLGVGLAQEAQQNHVQIVNEGTPGCSVSMQQQIKVLWYTVPPDAPCDVGQQPELVARHLAQVGGRLQPRRRGLRRPRRDLRPGGRGSVAERRPARLRQLPGEPVPPGGVGPGLQGGERRAADDPLLRQRGLPGGDTLARGRSRPGERRQPDHAGGGRRHAGGGRRGQGLRVRPQRPGLARPQVLADRRPDQRALRGRGALHAVGRHLRRAAAGARAGGARQGHATASPGGEWPGPLPPSTPSWFSKLPCP